jgi:hypothetical protein
MQKFFNSQQPQTQNQLLGMMAGISSAQSSEGMLQMIKKREKMNNSAMST